MSNDSNISLAAAASGKNQATAPVPYLKQTTDGMGKPNEALVGTSLPGKPGVKKFPIFGTITPRLLSRSGSIIVTEKNDKGQPAFPFSGATNNSDVYPEPQYISLNGKYYQQTQISRPNSTEPKHQPGTFNNAAPDVLSRQSAPGQSMVFSPAPAKVPMVVRTLEKKAVDFGSSVVSVLVNDGDTPKLFTVYEHVLRMRSNHFQWKIAQTKDKMVTVDGIDPEIFGLYIQIVYTNRVPTKPEAYITQSNAEYETLCKPYVLTHKFQDLAAQNLVLDAIHASYQESATLFGTAKPTAKPTAKIMEYSLPSRKHVELLYEGTERPCGARRLLVDMYASKAVAPWMRNHEEPFPAEFMRELALTLFDVNRMVKPVGSYYDMAAGADEGEEKMEDDREEKAKG